MILASRANMEFAPTTIVSRRGEHHAHACRTRHTHVCRAQRVRPSPEHQIEPQLLETATLRLPWRSVEDCGLERSRTKNTVLDGVLGRFKNTVWEREQPVSDPAREVHVQDQDRCYFVSKNGVYRSLRSNTNKAATSVPTVYRVSRINDSSAF
jgi:hypothetical protein